MRPLANRPLMTGGQRFTCRSGSVETLETRSMPVLGQPERKGPGTAVFVYTLSVLAIGIALGLIF